MEIKKIDIKDLKVGDTLYRGSLCKVTAISSPFMRSYGEDQHYYKAETVAITCESIMDYDVSYAKENGSEVTPRTYTFDYTTEGGALIVLTGETVTVTQHTGTFDEKTGHYLLPGQTIKMIKD